MNRGRGLLPEGGGGPEGLVGGGVHVGLFGGYMPRRPSVGPLHAPLTSPCPLPNHTTILNKLNKSPKISFMATFVTLYYSPFLTQTITLTLA